MKDFGGSDYDGTNPNFNTIGGSSDMTNNSSNSLMGTIKKSNPSDPFLEFQESDPAVKSKASSFKIKGGAKDLIIEERK